MNQTVTVDVYVDGNLVGSAQANTDRQDLVGAFGTSAARYHGFSYNVPANASWRSGQGHSIAVRIRGASTDVMSSPKTVSGCSGGTTNPNPPTPNPPSGNCAFSEGQFLLNWYGEQIYAHYANGILYAAYQNPGDGFKPQSWMQGTGFDPGKVSCFAVNNPLTSTPIPPVTNPPTTNPPSGNCAYSEGQFLLNWYGEQIYAHYFNGILYAAYQDGNVGFKPRSWLSDTGYDASKLACFATSDPHTTTTTNPTNNPQNPPNTAGNSLTGSFDYADCNSISGWIFNANTPNQSTKFDVYVNGWLAAAGVPAIRSRQDVANALGISGYNAFGFNTPLPSSYLVGTSLTISIKYAGTNSDIPGSPKTTEICLKISTNSNCDTHLASIFPKGMQARSTAVIHTNNEFSLQLNAGGKGSGSVSSLISKPIRVRRNDNLSLSVHVLSPVSSRRNLIPQIASAVIGSIGIRLATTQHNLVTPDQHRYVQTEPFIGIGTSLTLPFVKSLLTNGFPKAGVELAFYDKRGVFVHRQKVSINKTAGQAWQLLHLEGKAPQDGYAVIRLLNRGKSLVYFDDLIFQTNLRPEIDELENIISSPKMLSSKSDFATQIQTNEESIYSTSDDCNTWTGGAIKINGIGFVDLGTTVTAPAPVYTYIGGTIAIRSSDVGGGQANQTGGSSQRTPTDDVLRRVAQTKAIRMTTCAGLNNLWNWSYANNDPDKTVEMAGFELADGSLISIPWSGNSKDRTQFNINSTWLDNTGVYEYSFHKSQSGSGYIIQQRNALQGQGSAIKDIPIVSYVHTHPYSDGSHDTNNPTKVDSDGIQPFGDWQLSADYGIPGKIITPDKILNFHFDPNGETVDKNGKTVGTKQVVDPSEERQKDCSKQN